MATSPKYLNLIAKIFIAAMILRKNSLSMNSKESSFFEQIKGAKKVLVLDLGFLGDTVHLIPTLKCIRDALPNAQLDVMVSDHIQSILQLTPWVDNVLGYRRFPKGPKWYQDWGRLWKLWSARYDAVINVNGSERSSLLTFLTGSKYRLGRIPQKQRWHWKYYFTHTTFVPYGEMPTYRENWLCLKQAGFPGDEPVFGMEIPSAAASKVQGLLTDLTNPFIHVSPFTTEDRRELPIAQIASLLNNIHQQFPNLPIIISCAPNDRERSKLKQLLNSLSFVPAKIFAGTLNLVELAALINFAKLHLGGDSGAIHVAVMTGVPTLSWFHDYPHKKRWMPQGQNHRTLVGAASPLGLTGISDAALFDAFNQLVERKN